MEPSSKISPIIFIASVICFLLPFVTVSCGGQRVASFTGLQLAVGTSVEEPRVFAPPVKRPIESNPLAALALLCAVAGAAVGFMEKPAVVSAVAGSLGAIALLAMKSRVDDQTLLRGQGMIQLDYGIGFTLTLLLLLGGAGWNWFLYSKARKQKGVVPPPSPLFEGEEPSGHPPPG